MLLDLDGRRLLLIFFFLHFSTRAFASWVWPGRLAPLVMVYVEDTNVSLMISLFARGELELLGVSFASRSSMLCVCVCLFVLLNPHILWINN